MMRLIQPEILTEIGTVSTADFKNQLSVEIPAFFSSPAKEEDVEGSLPGQIVTVAVM